MGEQSDVSMDSASGGFSGTERFVVEGRLGEGGMGVVYRAHDRELGRTVALKTMTRIDPGSLLRFKKEFRALADITHPSVVDLYELISEGEHWFFTMELVDGLDFLAYVQESAPRSSERNGPLSLVRELATQAAVAPTLDASTLPDGVLSEQPSSARGALRCCVQDPERLRAALRQLTEGVIAIHAAGKLHRDIKPSNVLVTRSGRVVLLDFGVVGDYVRGRSGDAGDDALLGTPAYMAPEQAARGSTLPASDFYGVGAMLFEALTDDLPFVGTPREILAQKRELDAPTPSSRVADVPPDLDELCAELLARDPGRRPSGEEILRRLGKSGRARSVITVTGAQGSFVGRRAQLDELDHALAQSREGRPVVVFVNGRSGMGKTALVQHYFERLREDPDVLLLAGRCYERESVPFKGIDSVVDELSRFLMRLPDTHVATLVPEGIHELSRVFPVLRNVRAVEAQPPPEHAVVEPHEIRRRAFAAFKRLLSSLSSQWSVVVHIDDLQWSDVDSAGLIQELLAPPDPPPLLLVCGYRDELAADSLAVQELSAGLKRLEDSQSLHRVVVERLSEAEAIELAESSVETGPAPTPELLRAIARESQGVPFFVAELVRWQYAGRGRATLEQGTPISLEQVIAARVDALPPASKKLLSLLAVAGGPLDHATASKAAGIGTQDRVAVNVLRSQRLARSYSHLDGEQLDTFHARVRETVVAALGTDERQKLHLALADTLERSTRADPEALLEHLLAAGERERARRYAVPAARAAADSLAFLRAARLYRLAIDLEADAEPHRLHRKLADALVNAGRSAKAAEAYLAGASTAPSDDAIEMRRLAAEHFLKSGREQQGLVLLKAVLAEVDLSFPRSTAAALASLLAERARLALRGREPEHIKQGASEQELLKLDVAFSAAVGLAMFDLVRGAQFSARHLRLALSAGEPVRLGRALALEAANTVAVGDGSRERSERHVRRAEELATRIDDPHGIALAKLTAGLVRFFVGEWRSSNKVLDEATVLLRERCQAVAWELANSQAWSCNSLILMGELAETSRRVPAFVKEALEREDRYALVNIIYAACITHIVADDVEAAWHVTTEEGGFYTPSGFTAGHWGAMVSAISVHRYRGEGRAALARAQHDWKPLERSQLLRVNVVRLTSLFERGLCAVAAAQADSSTKPLGEAEHYVRRLRRERLRFAPPLGEHLAACAAAARGDERAAERALARAIAGYEQADMGYLASCARCRRGQVLGGDEGAALRARATAELEAQGVKNVERCLEMSAPGFAKWVR